MTLARLLDRAALRHPEAPAVVDGARRVTYAGLASQAAAVGRGFAGLGVGKKEIPKTASGKILRRLLRDGQYVEGTA